MPLEFKKVKMDAVQHLRKQRAASKWQPLYEALLACPEGEGVLVDLAKSRTVMGTLISGLRYLTNRNPEIKKMKHFKISETEVMISLEMNVVTIAIRNAKSDVDIATERITGKTRTKQKPIPLMGEKK